MNVKIARKAEQILGKRITEEKYLWKCINADICPQCGKLIEDLYTSVAFHYKQEYKCTVCNWSYMSREGVIGYL